MKKGKFVNFRLFLLVLGICVTSLSSVADDSTTTETCANGAGTVIVGAVSGRKYCSSNHLVTWWNAHTWCDGLGRRLFSMNDCEFSGASKTTICPELKKGSYYYVWVAEPIGLSNAYGVTFSTGGFLDYPRSHPGNHHALCY